MALRERDRSQRSGSGRVKTVGQLGSSRSSGHQPEQLRGPRARIMQGREAGCRVPTIRFIMSRRTTKRKQNERGSKAMRDERHPRLSLPCGDQG